MVGQEELATKRMQELSHPPDPVWWAHPVDATTHPGSEKGRCRPIEQLMPKILAQASTLWPSSSRFGPANFAASAGKKTGVSFFKNPRG
jgi:hypothetical protein